MRFLTKILFVALATGFSVAHAAPGDIHPTELPLRLVSESDTVAIRWLEPVTAILEIGATAGEWTDTVTTSSSGIGQLDFIPAGGNPGVGVWAAQLRNPGTDQTSLPFPVYVEAPNAPAMVSPPNGGTVDPGTTLLGWEPVLGVPFYHIVFSDQEITIGENDEGDPIISGANIIWQAITSATAIDYGAIDPSGFFTEMNGSPPPLVAGLSYNWIVLNNYGNHPVLTSVRQAGVSSFTVSAPDGLDPPVLEQPAEGDSLSSDTICFTWSDVDAAAHYHFYLSQIVEAGGSETSVPVFDQVCGQSTLYLPAASMLVASAYQWKVIALDDSGQGATSESRLFHYDIPVADLTIVTRDGFGAPLPHVNIDITALAGGGSAQPVVTGDSGGSSVELVPGTYLLEATKDGYESAALECILEEGSNPDALLVLPESPATLAGFARDEDLAPVAFATVSARHVQTGELREVQCGSGGDFQMGLVSGEWELTPAANGYHHEETASVVISAGEYLELPQPLILVANNATISGSVVSGSGEPISAALVMAADGTSDQVQQTGNGGLFQFSLPGGSWQVTVSKDGFASPPPRTIELGPGEDLEISPPLVLDAQAGIVSGFVMSDGNIVPNALVTATPVAGSSVQIFSGAVGDYQLSLAAGTWTLSAACDGYSPSDPVQLSLQPGGSQDGVNLQLMANPCLITGTVSDGSNPLGGATVGNGSVWTLSEWNGDYELSLPSGAQTIEAWLDGYGPSTPLDVDLAPGQILNGLDLVLTPNAATVSGRVLSEGQPVAMAQVFAATATDTLLRSSQWDGSFDISVSPGTTTFWAAKEGMSAVDSVTLTLGSGQTYAGLQIDLLSATCTINGFALSDGAGLRDVLVRATSSLGESATTSNLDGSWQLLLPSGTAWHLEASRETFAGDSITSPLMNTGDEWSHDFEMEEQSAWLEGQLADDEGQPVGGALITLTGAELLQTQTTPGGSWTLGLQPGIWSLEIDLEGYAPHQQTLSVASGSQDLDIVLTTLFASLSGQVLDDLGQPIAGAALSATRGDANGSAISDEEGRYLFPRLIAGSYDLLASAPGHGEIAQTLTLAENGTAVLDWVLPALSGTLEGIVLSESDEPLVGALIQAKDGSLLIAQTSSGEDGCFQFSSLPEDRPLSLRADLPGYSIIGANPIEGLVPPVSGITFRFSINDGILRGYVRNLSDQSPVAGATVFADDDQGSFGQAVSDSAGYFWIADLRGEGSYRLVADADGWAAVEKNDLPASGSPVVFLLPSARSALYGSLYPEREDLPLPQQTAARCVPIAGGSTSTALLNGNGSWILEDLLPGEYSLLFDLDGYVTEPKTLTLSVDESQVLGPYDFQLIAAPLASVDVEGPADIDNDSGILYRGSMRDESGESVAYPLTWSLSPESAGSIDPVSGRFTPDDSFIGLASLTARNERTGISGSIDVQVFAQVDENSSGQLHGNDGVLLDLPQGALAQDVRLTFTPTECKPVLRRAGDCRVEGRLLHFLPDGLEFNTGAEPSLFVPVPENLLTKRLAVGWWDPHYLAWEVLTAERVNGGVQRELEHFSDYALLVGDEPLGIENARISPNPFSPMAGGCEIVFDLNSQVSDRPLVDIEIFNMRGERLRTLLSASPIDLGVQVPVPWDGLTDRGQLARNGRYVVRIRARDAGGQVEEIMTAVLIK